MSKAPPQKSGGLDVSRFEQSTFTLTFAVEILGVDVWHDCNEGWLDLGPCVQGIKLQYQLYPGRSYDVDIVIWPHVAKVWCGVQRGWVKTFQFLERRFLAFSIDHAFPVRVMELQSFTATLTPTIGLTSLGSNAKNDKNSEVLLPALKFGERRYFGPVLEAEISISEYVTEMIWSRITAFIPASIFDATFDLPHSVSDIRHQDTIMYYVKESILSTVSVRNKQEGLEVIKDIKDSKVTKDKEVKKVSEQQKVKFELKISGDSILAGVGRLVKFEKFGETPNDFGEIIAIISSNNLPAQDDQPIIFVNVETLFDAPIEYFKKLKITHIYTRWKLGEEIHSSNLQALNSEETEINFDDHHALPMVPNLMSNVTAVFLENPFEIQLRGIRMLPPKQENSILFGYKKGDQSFGNDSCKLIKEDTDFIIAVTKIDARRMSQGINKFIKEEYPLYPPATSVVDLKRKELCTNDANHIKAPTKPFLVVPPHVVLESQMTLAASVGFVGCKPKKLAESYARLFCFIERTESILVILKQITEINDKILQSDIKDGLLTGFAIDVGKTVVIYIEGRIDGPILEIWEKTGDFHDDIKAVFCSCKRYATRIYPEWLMSVSFNVLKMYVPLGVVLACPPVYARPALPLPARSAVLKLGRLIAGKLRRVPCRCEIPSPAELKSFRLELCVASKPAIMSTGLEAQESKQHMVSQQTITPKINWHQKCISGIKHAK